MTVRPAGDQWVQVSPVLVLCVGHITARIFAPHLGAWAWLPVMLVYWTTMLLVALSVDALSTIRAALRRPSGVGWWIPCVLVGLLPLPILLRFHSLLFRSPFLTVAWFVVALLNPFFEEGYWRGLLGEATRKWPGWLACAYSSALFTASHPMMWGVFSTLNQRADTALSLFVMGLLWSLVYRRSSSLQPAIVSHALVDLGNLSVFAFLNLFSASGWR